MKLKIRADGKDFAIFGAFSIVVLYLVAIAVLNLASFSTSSEFSGLNPIPAFTDFTYLIPTLIIYVIIIVVVITSVSSYFFEFDKGIGLSTEPKKEKGYSRWCTEKEMKKVLKMVDAGAETSDAAGIPILNDGKHIWVDDGEFHNLIIGSTGSGKTEMTIQPMVKVLAKKGESMIITDPKGEIYEKNALELKEKGYNIVLLNFRNPQNGNCWNPLTLPYSLFKAGNQDKAIELLEDLASNILYDENNKGGDPFWEKTSADYFAGLALALFKDAKEEEINLNSINLMTTAGEDKIGNTTYIKEYFSDKDQASSEYINVASTIMAPNETKSSILSVFKQKIKLFSSRENLSEMLSRSDFDMNDIGRKKTAVFIVIQDEKKTYHSLVTIFLKQCYETLISVAQECGGHLPYRTNFILDEFANMPPLKDVTTMVTAARSRHIRFSFVIQNFAQLYEVYGKENGETIKGNCGNIIYLISSELAALEEISKLCGEVKSKDKDKTASTPLVTVSDLQRLPQWTLIVIRIRMMPFKTKLTPNWQMVEKNSWGKNYDLASYPVRQKGTVQTFDIKGFVDKKKEEKVTNMLNNITGGSSKPVDTGFNPFAPSKPSSSSKPTGGFDVDEMVRRIDAKIAELEEEERQEKEKEEKEKKNRENMEIKDDLVSNIPSTENPSASDDIVPMTVPVIDSSNISIPKFDIDDNKEEKEDVISKVEMSQLNDNSDEDTSGNKSSSNIEIPKSTNSIPLLDDEDDDDESGSTDMFGLKSSVFETENKDNLKVEEEHTNVVPVQEKETKSSNQFFDFIVPVKEEEKKEVKESENTDLDKLNIPESLIDGILPKSEVGEQELHPVDALPNDNVKIPAVEEKVEIPVNENKFITKEEPKKVEVPISNNDDSNNNEEKKSFEPKVIDNNYITDDQFFDDFFSDDE